MKMIIICPLDIRTGGPEALHQLSDAAIDQGFDAEFWYYTDQDIANFNELLSKRERLVNRSFSVPARKTAIEEYQHYKTKPFTHYDLNDRDIVFVIPEALLWTLPLFAGRRVLLWWLSVDYAMAPLGRLNANVLRLPWITHAAQSFYAAEFLKPLGINAKMLTDFTSTPVPQKRIPLDKRPLSLTINAGNKVVFDIDQITTIIRSEVAQLEVVKIAGLSRGDVLEAFANSRLFIDLGNLPGCDRMAREAITLGALPLISNSGAGLNDHDFNFPSLYKPAPYAYSKVAKIAAQMILKPELHTAAFNHFRMKVDNEKANFTSEVLSILSDL